jgi:thiamine kinase-like enzyme
MTPLARALVRVPTLHGASAASAVRLGGLTNLNYLVVHEDSRYVVRVPGTGTHEYIDRAAEEHAARSASAAGVNAEVLFFDATDGLMVTRFVDSSVTMSPGRFEDLGAVARAGEAFRRLHTRARPFATDFDVFELIDEYRTLLSSKHVELPAVYRDCEAAAEASRRALRSGPGARRPSVPSHCDPLCENFLDTGDRMYLIDYEYAGNNDPMWDLADLSVEGSFGPEQDATLLRAYLGADPPAEDEGRMVVFKAMCDLVWGLWGMIQHANANPVDDFLTYATNRLERCLALMSHPRYDTHLAAVRVGSAQ